VVAGCVGLPWAACSAQILATCLLTIKLFGGNAVETQAAAVAATKAAGLRRHYGIDGPGVAFWDVHADLEADHADWTASALAATAASPAQVTSAAADGARAWWQFLDERQTAA
jgi:pyrroloquinoline quinone (PQQ) biosynthesis protein C